MRLAFVELEFDKMVDEDDQCRSLLDVGCWIGLVFVVTPPAIGDAPFPPSVRMLVTVDTSPAESVVVENYACLAWNGTKMDIGRVSIFGRVKLDFF
jgi:hypothetical protein